MSIMHVRVKTNTYHRDGDRLRLDARQHLDELVGVYAQAVERTGLGERLVRFFCEVRRAAPGSANMLS